MQSDIAGEQLLRLTEIKTARNLSCWVHATSVSHPTAGGRSWEGGTAHRAWQSPGSQAPGVEPVPGQGGFTGSLQGSC